MDQTARKRAKPTAEDLRAAARLKKMWLAMPRQARPTQDALAERWGEGGSQSLISQYMNGVIPLNIRAVMFFARELNVRPDEIYPGLPGLDAFTMLYEKITGKEYPEGVREEAPAYGGEQAQLDAQWQAFSLEQKRSILDLVRLAGVIGVTTRPVAKPPDLKRTAPGADLRTQRRLQRRVVKGARDGS